MNTQMLSSLQSSFFGIATLKAMKNLTKYLLIVLVLGFGLAACEPNEAEDAVEDAGAAVEDTVEDAGSAVEGAAEDAGDATEDAAEDATDGN